MAQRCMAETSQDCTLDEYLRRKGLTAVECVAQSPHALVGWIKHIVQSCVKVERSTGGWPLERFKRNALQAVSTSG